ncbi:unnamed protein product [Heterosigma akashiwo]|mmetsp:Transcript_20441/g.32304  ORF Transcript_20441/g.32304 Transcript_20441/m.32304 type:complete len:226 (-) Transcript_20441:359-1036(-)
MAQNVWNVLALLVLLIQAIHAVTGESVVLRVKMPDGVIKRVQASPADSINDIKEKAGISKKKKFALDEERTRLCSATDTIEGLGLSSGAFLFCKQQSIDNSADFKERLASKKPDLNRAGKKVPEATSAAELEKLIKLAGPKLLVVDFYADWCGPCKQIAPEFQKMFEEMGGVNFAKVNVDKNKESSQKYQVKSMPTFVFIKNGAEVHRVQGANAAGLRSDIQARM